MSNPYQPGPYGGPGGYAQPHPQGTTVLVLGILGLVVCPIVSIFGLVQGNRALREIDANPMAYNNRQSVTIGRVLSIVALALYGALIVVYGIILIIALVASQSA